MNRLPVGKDPMPYTDSPAAKAEPVTKFRPVKNPPFRLHGFLTSCYQFNYCCFDHSVVYVAHNINERSKERVGAINLFSCWKEGLCLVNKLLFFIFFMEIMLRLGAILLLSSLWRVYPFQVRLWVELNGICQNQKSLIFHWQLCCLWIWIIESFS